MDKAIFTLLMGNSISIIIIGASWLITGRQSDRFGDIYRMRARETG